MFPRYRTLYLPSNLQRQFGPERLYPDNKWLVSIGIFLRFVSPKVTTGAGLQPDIFVFDQQTQ